MKTLFIMNGAAYGSDATYNGLRLASALARRERNVVRVYLMGDAVSAAKAGQKVPEGYYNIQTILQTVLRGSESKIGVCAACMDARGIQAGELMDGTHRGSLEELADWTEWAEKVLVF